MFDHTQPPQHNQSTNCIKRIQRMLIGFISYISWCLNDLSASIWLKRRTNDLMGIIVRSGLRRWANLFSCTRDYSTHTIISHHITSYHIISHYIISIRNHTWYIHTHTLCRNPNKNWDTPFPARSQEPSIAGMLSCRKSLESLAMKCGRANHGPPPLGQPGRDHSGSCWASQSSKVLKALSKIFKTKNIS